MKKKVNQIKKNMLNELEELGFQLNYLILLSGLFP